LDFGENIVDALTLIDTQEQPEKKIQNNTAAAIIVSVLRRLLRDQIVEYDRALDILDAADLSEPAAKIVNEEPGIVAALYAIIYDQNGQLRVDDHGQPLGLKFIEGKILNMKANPYKGEEAMLLQGIFQGLRAKMGGGNTYRKYCREIFHRLHDDVV